MLETSPDTQVARPLVVLLRQAVDQLSLLLIDGTLGAFETAPVEHLRLAASRALARLHDGGAPGGRARTRAADLLRTVIEEAEELRVWASRRASDPGWPGLPCGGPAAPGPRERRLARLLEAGREAVALAAAADRLLEAGREAVGLAAAAQRPLEPRRIDAAATGRHRLRGRATAPAPEPVRLGASAPATVPPGAEFTARFVAYPRSAEADTRELLERVGRGAAAHLGLRSCAWQPGTRAAVRVSGRHFAVDEPCQELVWNGDRELLDFDVSVAPDAPAGIAGLRYDVSVDGIAVARIRVDVEIGPGGPGAPRRVACAAPARRAFASYSSEDRLRVLDRVAAVRISTGLDVFLDCLSLMPGDRWKARLAAEIRGRDTFLLFWSASARRSPWVAWEWRTALRTRGLEAMQIHPLDPPAEAPAPPELESLHFGDVHMLARAAGSARP